MGTIQLLGSAMGLGLLAGFRLYATVLALGAAIRLGWLELDPAMAGLQVLADARVLAVAAGGFLMEFLADKIPWVDSLWDAVHTLVRPVGAAFLAAAAVGTMSPAAQVVTALLAGGIAFSGHSAKAATRMMVNQSPEPFSNVALSAAGDLAAPLGLWVAIEHPYVMLGILAAFLTFFFWISPKLFRVVKLELKALGALFGDWFSPVSGTARAASLPPEYARGAFAEASGALSARLEPLPEEYARRLKAGSGYSPMGVPCAAGRGVRGLANSTGYLCPGSSGLLFLARRGLRARSFEIPLNSVTACRVKRGFLLDRLVLATGRGEISFHLFKASAAEEAVPSGSANTGVAV